MTGRTIVCTPATPELLNFRKLSENLKKEIRIDY